MSADGHQHGGLTEEAARLIEVLESALFHGRTAAAPGRWLSDLVGDFDRDGAAPSAEECRYCPVCRAISAVRGIRPEALEHLRDAGTSIIAALRLATEGLGGHPDGASSEGHPSKRSDPEGSHPDGSHLDFRARDGEQPDGFDDRPAQAQVIDLDAPPPAAERDAQADEEPPPVPGLQHIPIF